LRKSRPAARSRNAAQSAVDDIPIAQRDRFTPAVTTMTGLRRQRNHMARAMFFTMGISIASLMVLAFFYFGRTPESSNSVASSSESVATIENSDVVLGHFRYEEAPANELTSIGGKFKLRSMAANKFRAMVAAARSAGVNITTISAFRSVAEQQHLFFDVKAQRAQVTTKRAEVSAPPHHSEHHTGYAVDLGDGNTPGANLNQGFDQTAAYKWLQTNAARYSFELSFPQGNAQGVSYEPWHWRYVGDSNSLETFYKAHKSQPSANPK
jgi:zinc D-Ala-D-Ala carboxypeptidase